MAGYREILRLRGPVYPQPRPGATGGGAVMAATVSDGLKALNAADLSALKARIDALRAAAEQDLARKKQDAEDFIAALERAKRIGLN